MVFKISGWAPYWQLNLSLSTIEKNKDVFGDILLFGWECHANSTVTSQFYDPIPTPRLKTLGLPYWATFTSAMNGKQAADLFDSQSKSQILASNMINIAKNIGASGLDLDFESINFGHSGDSLARIQAGYPRFLALLKSYAGTLKVSATIPARVADNDPDWRTYDFARIGAAVDIVRIMTYDYHDSGSSPGPVSPLDWYTKVITYAKTRMPAYKIQSGIPAYGYDWGTNGGITVNAKDVEALASKNGTTIRYDSTVAEGTFSYSGHVVWVATAQGMAARISKAKSLGINGAAIWSIGDEPLTAWPIMRTAAGIPTPSPIPVPIKPKISTAHVVQAAKTDPKLPQGKSTYPSEVKIVEQALAKEGLLAQQWVDGAYGTKTIDAYKLWQKKLGYTGNDADGIPGQASLTKLGQKYGFTVVT